MKQYVIDELRPEDYRKLKVYLDKNFKSSDIDGIYWIRLQQEILSDVQAGHTECQPFYIAIELKPDIIVCELLVRTKTRMRCECISYATEKQLSWIIKVMDGIFDKLEIIT